jgi:translation initiation factor IF-1
VKDDVLVTTGTVVESFRGDRHAVEITLPGGRTHRVLARRAGKLVMSRILLLPLDRVELELCPYDLSHGRIVRRCEKRAA